MTTRYPPPGARRRRAAQLTYKDGPVERIQGTPVGKFVQAFTPPADVEEFRMERCQLPPKSSAPLKVRRAGRERRVGRAGRSYARTRAVWAPSSAAPPCRARLPATVGGAV